MTQVGSVIDGKYRVIDQIGEGGMSIVWLVTDSRLNKQWAIKEIKKNARTETHKVIVDSLRAEANLMKGLDHPALPRIVDIIEDGDSLYVVMDFIQGDDLLSILKNHRRVITEEDVVDWGIQLCDALTYLHSKGIVYRDMKPGNVMLMADGTVKIIDFGIAREYSPDKEDDTMPLGTRGYASPEAFKRGVQTTPVSDIYSLGVTLFHLVTGHGPMEYVDRPTLPPIREINPALSEGLEYVIIRATQWNPVERYQSCVEMRYDLEHLDKLTNAHRSKLERTMMLFKAFAIAGVVCLVLGIGTMVASNLVRSNTYEDIMARAAVASKEEVGGQASEAEQLYMQAIGIQPDDIRAYSALVDDVYRSDNDEKFSTSESSRWVDIFNKNQRSISNNSEFATLCFNVGYDYFFYYEYGDDLTRGMQSVTWFEKALANPSSSFDDTHRTAANTYLTIGNFSKVLADALKEGNEAQAFEDYWGALEQAVAGLSNRDSVQVRMYMYSVVFSAIDSPSYLAGFNRAEISPDRVNSLLNEVYERTAELKEATRLDEKLAEKCDNILDNYDAAVANVQNVYGNVGTKIGSGSITTSSSGTAGSSSSSGRGAN